MLDSEKYINTIELETGRYEIWTDTGWEELTHVHRTVEFDVWEVSTRDFTLQCADEHILFDGDMREVYVSDLSPGDTIMTELGPQTVEHVGKTDKPPENMYDLTVDSDRHSFFSSGILSHNSTMTQIFVLWTICFKQNQKVAILANKEETAISIIDRIQLAYRRLPLWIKPGIEDWSKKSFSTDNQNSRCRVFSAPTSKTAIRGLSCNLLVLDEAAHIDASIVDEFWEAVFPVISSSKTSKVFMVSTCNGVHNLFYKIFTEATKSSSIWHPETIMWYDVPGRDENWAKEVRSGLSSESAWEQEFESAVGTTTLNLENHENPVSIQDLWEQIDETERHPYRVI